jgi:hypothetical protein
MITLSTSVTDFTRRMPGGTSAIGGYETTFILLRRSLFAGVKK